MKHFELFLSMIVDALCLELSIVYAVLYPSALIRTYTGTFKIARFWGIRISGFPIIRGERKEREVRGIVRPPQTEIVSHPR